MTARGDPVRDGVLTVVPARGGSKGIPQKNVQELDGKPLVAHQIEAAVAASMTGTPILTTDDDEIAAIGREHGASVPFIRPLGLATDKVPVIAAVQHSAEYFANEGWSISHVVCLQPTSPFTRPETIDAAVKKAKDAGCDGVATVAEVTETHPFRAYRLVNDRIEPFSGLTVESPNQRQDRPDVYGFTGAVYVRSYEVLKQWKGDDFALGDDIRAVIQDEREAFDIDTPFELRQARALCAYEI